MDKLHTPEGQAKVLFQDGTFKIEWPGRFVVCAVSGEHIPLELLRYWSVERQEAYASPQYALQRELEIRSAARP